jgi:hypothetical protein
MADLSDLKTFTSRKKTALATDKDLRFLDARSKKADTFMSSSKSVSQKPHFVTRKAFKSKPQQEVSAEEEARGLSYASSKKTKKDLGEYDWASRELLKHSKAPLGADAVQFRKYVKQTEKLADGTSRLWRDKAKTKA